MPNWKNNSLCRCQDYSMIDGLFQNTRISKGGTPLPHPPSSEPKARARKVYPNLRLNNNQSLCFPSLLYCPRSSIMVRFCRFLGNEFYVRLCDYYMLSDICPLFFDKNDFFFFQFNIVENKKYFFTFVALK